MIFIAASIAVALVAADLLDLSARKRQSRRTL